MRGFTSILQLSILFISGFALVNASAQDEVIEEVVVTASFIDQVASEIGNPLHIVNGDELSKGATLSLGASLENLLGVSSSDFGSGVGQPIIRGLSGNRVKILNNGMVVRDISGVGPDHINEVDMNNVQQIEVIRGPSSLLYSNGVIGGIVNVVDNTIARKDFEESDFKIGLEGQSVNDGHAYDISYQGNLGGINVSVDYKESDFGNFDIPTGAVLHSEEDHDEDHEEEHAETNYFDRDINNTSFALSLSRDLTDSLDASLSFSSVERAPHASELYMNGPHLATGRLEVGNSSLESEKANNFDLTLNFEKDGFFGSFTYFRNNVDNYIYLLDETEEEHEEEEGRATTGVCRVIWSLCTASSASPSSNSTANVPSP